MQLYLIKGSPFASSPLIQKSLEPVSTLTSYLIPLIYKWSWKAMWLVFRGTCIYYSSWSILGNVYASWCLRLWGGYCNKKAECLRSWCDLTLGIVSSDLNDDRNMQGCRDRITVKKSTKRFRFIVMIFLNLYIQLNLIKLYLLIKQMQYMQNKTCSFFHWFLRFIDTPSEFSLNI